jgi:serine/threonine protein kinase
VTAQELKKREVENPNRKISDYQLLRVIGTGTFGKVYLATMGA